MEGGTRIPPGAKVEDMKNAVNIGILEHLRGLTVLTSTRNQTGFVPIEVYHEVYLESIRNAEMLIEEAKLIAESKSKTHARMLHNFAIEEVAKGYACLLAACGMIPRNHPLVLRWGKGSVFTQHDVKYSFFAVVAQDLFLKEIEKAKRGERSIFVGHETEYLTFMAVVQESLSKAFQKAGIADAELTGDEGIHARAVAGAITGPKATKKRFEWMYVDVVKQAGGLWFVSSPLKSDPKDTGPDFGLTELVIAQVKSVDGMRESPEFDAFRRKYREFLSRLDASLPKNPVW